MPGLIDKFRLYLPHFENLRADTSKQTDKATMEGKQKLLTDSNVLLRCGLFVDLLDPAKKFSLVSQKESFGIIELVKELDDMFLIYYLMKQRFERNPEAIFSLPNLHKVMSGVKVGQNENGTLYKYQDITLQYCERKKREYSKKYQEVHRHDLGGTHRKIWYFIRGKRSWGRQKWYSYCW